MKYSKCLVGKRERANCQTPIALFLGYFFPKKINVEVLMFIHLSHHL